MLNRKRGLTLEMIRNLHRNLGIPAGSLIGVQRKASGTKIQRRLRLPAAIRASAAEREEIAEARTLVPPVVDQALAQQCVLPNPAWPESVNPEERAAIEAYLGLPDASRRVVGDWIALLAAVSADRKRR